jgi:hypothetical protein
MVNYFRVASPHATRNRMEVARQFLNRNFDVSQSLAGPTTANDCGNHQPSESASTQQLPFLIPSRSDNARGGAGVCQAL